MGTTNLNVDTTPKLPTFMMELYVRLLRHNWRIVSCTRQDPFEYYLIEIEAPNKAQRAVYTLDMC